MISSTCKAKDYIEISLPDQGGPDNLSKLMMENLPKTPRHIHTMIHSCMEDFRGILIFLIIRVKEKIIIIIINK